MNARTALAALTLCATFVFAEPPPQSELSRQDLARMKAADREELDTLLGVGCDGLGEVTLLSADDPGIDNFKSRVVVIQPWTFNDPASQKALEQLATSLEGLDVMLIALHPQQEQDKVQRMLDRRPLPGTIVLDANDHYFTPLGLGVRGANLIVDRNNTIRYTGINPTAVRPLVLELIDEKVDPTRTPEVTVTGFAERKIKAKELRTQIEQAWMQGDLDEGTRLLDQMWDLERATAANMSRTLLASRDSIQSVVGLDQIARHATAPTLLDVIAGLNPRSQRGEIALLVRALGSRDIEEPGTTLAPFLNASDPYVEQAALYALAEVGSPGDLALFVDDMRNAPIAMDDVGQDDDDRLMLARFGAAYKLTGYRGIDGRDYAQWLQAYQADPKQAEQLARQSVTDAQNRPLSVQYGSDTFNTYNGFDYTTRIRSAYISGADPNTPQRFGATMQRINQAASMVLGGVQPAPFRVYVADYDAFASLASNTYMEGQSSINKVYIRLQAIREMDAVFAHEYVHVLHQAMYEDQPRWLSEGLADSVAFPGTRWSLAQLSHVADAAQVVEAGVFTRLLSWAHGASSDRRENQNYDLSYMAVDFLRFGPYPAGDTRLNLVMSAISQGRGERQALAQYYADVLTLDAQLRDWLIAP